MKGAAGGGTSPEELTSCQLRGENLAEVPPSPIQNNLAFFVALDDEVHSLYSVCVCSVFVDILYHVMSTLTMCVGVRCGSS